MYGVPYMLTSSKQTSSKLTSSKLTSSKTAPEIRPSEILRRESAPASRARVPAGRCLRLTLRGFSPAELKARAERECACHFGECEWKLEQAEFVTCVGSLGGRVRLYEGRFVATA